MMLTRATIERKNAFTLIEVLLAVSVFALVLGAINSVFFSALRLRNKTIESFDRARPMNYALATIQKDLEGIMAPGGKFSGKFTTTLEGVTNMVTSFIGERVSPDIYTTIGTVNELARWADVLKVSYFLALPTNDLANSSGGRELVRQVTRNLLSVNVEEPETQYLLSGVQQMLFQYYDGLTWSEVWDGNILTNLPTAIKVQITLTEDYTGSVRQDPAPIELVVPILVQAPTAASEEEEEE